MTLLWIIIATFIDSLVGLAGIFTLWVSEGLLQRVVKILVAFSAGALIGGALFHLLAESLEKMVPMISLEILTVGFLVFFLLEGYLHWHLCEGECERHPYSYLMVIGDSIHNVMDGLVIAGAFMVSFPLGIVTTLVIIAHEVPQELGIFCVLVSGGFSKWSAIFSSFFAQCTCVLGGIGGYLFMSKMMMLADWMLPFAAGGFIYIAAADLIPTMHEAEGAEKITSSVWLILGILFMLYIKLAFNA